LAVNNCGALILLVLSSVQFIVAVRCWMPWSHNHGDMNMPMQLSVHFQVAMVW